MLAVILPPSSGFTHILTACDYTNAWDVIFIRIWNVFIPLTLFGQIRDPLIFNRFYFYFHPHREGFRISFTISHPPTAKRGTYILRIDFLVVPNCLHSCCIGLLGVYNVDSLAPPKSRSEQNKQNEVTD